MLVQLFPYIFTSLFHGFILSLFTR